MHPSPSSPTAQSFAAVPLFPLPNLVLFPHAVQFLHIFEERYKAMTADVLAGNRLIAMALLRPGWQNDYYSRPAIEPVVCVGRILNHERLDDGRYNFLLRGEARARILRERRDGPWHEKSYRVAELMPLEEAPVLEIDLDAPRRHFVRLFEHSGFRGMQGASQFRRLLDGQASTATVADLLAFTYLDDIPLKQSLLAEPNVRCRVERTLEALESSPIALQDSHVVVPADPSLN